MFGPVQTALQLLRTHGWRVTVSEIRRWAFGWKPPVIVSAEAVAHGGIGLEIGGPSDLFRVDNPIPLYPSAARLDCLNYLPPPADEADFRPHPLLDPGKWYTGEMTDLSALPTGYDFVCSCHALEHTANPLKALAEWARVLRPGGALVLVLPHRDGTFDHRRPVTSLSHLIDDQRCDRGEDDRTHLEESFKLFDHTRAPWLGPDWQAFCEETVRRNPEMRTAHHHVFDTMLVGAMLDHAGWKLIGLEPFGSLHVIAVAVRPDGTIPDNERFLNPRAKHFRHSPFPSDLAHSRKK